jgi:hypothetical protein
VEWLKHAFAIDKPGPATPNSEQGALVDRLCAEVVRRRLTTPALLMLEMHRPLNYATAQLLHFLQPLVGIVADTGGYVQFTKFLEQRGSIDYICQRIEDAEARAAKEGPAGFGSASSGADASAAERHGDH